jgi:hypothetical protein
MEISENKTKFMAVKVPRDKSKNRKNWKYFGVGE